MIRRLVLRDRAAARGPSKVYPRLTEKTSKHPDRNVYLFEFGKKDNKFDIKKFFKDSLKVDVEVNITNRKGKFKKVARARTYAKRSDKKLGYITFPKGFKPEGIAV